MKQCTFCKQHKPLTEFNRNKSKSDGLQNKCRDCSHLKFKEYYSKNKKRQRIAISESKVKAKEKAYNFVVEYFKNNPCVDCGNSDIRVLEFDHVEGFEKKNGVGVLIQRGNGLNVIREEISKCQVRCRNCHTIKTYDRIGGTWHSRYMDYKL